MRDLVVLVADGTMEAMVSEALKRHQAIGVRQIDFWIIRHPNKDPGCFNDPATYLTAYQNQFLHAIVLLDCEFAGAPAGGRGLIESLLSDRLKASALEEWAHPIAIEPELENWVWIDSPHVAEAMDWSNTDGLSPREWLEGRGLWDINSSKPLNPKEALEATCAERQVPFSSAIHTHIAKKASLAKCTDPAFLALRNKLQTWFPLS